MKGEKPNKGRTIAVWANSDLAEVLEHRWPGATASAKLTEVMARFGIMCRECTPPLSRAERDAVVAALSTMHAIGHPDWLRGRVQLAVCDHVMMKQPAGIEDVDEFLARVRAWTPAQELAVLDAAESWHARARSKAAQGATVPPVGR